MLRFDFWNAAKSTHSYEFWMHMRNLKPKKEQKPYDWLLKILMSQWLSHAFWLKAKCDHYTNKITEFFNNWVGKLKGLPLINFIDSVREKCMLKFHKRHTKATSWQDKIIPRTKKFLDDIIRKTRFLKLILGKNDEFEVYEDSCRFVVSLHNKTCIRGWWAINGLPYKHATKAISYNGTNIQDYCHEYYTVEAYLRVYKGSIHAIS